MESLTKGWVTFLSAALELGRNAQAIARWPRLTKAIENIGLTLMHVGNDLQGGTLPVSDLEYEKLALRQLVKAVRDAATGEGDAGV